MAKNNKKNQPQENLETLPCDLGVERSILGIMLLDALGYHQFVSAGLKVEMFALESNRKIFLAIQSLITHQKPADLILVCDELDKNFGGVRSVGDAGYISSLIDGVPDRIDTELARHYCGIVREKAMRRGVILLANRVAASAIDPSDPIRHTLGCLHDDILRIQGETSGEGYTIEQISGKLLEEVTDQMYIEREVIGIPFGIKELDEVTTGMRDAECCVVGGFAGSGKSAFGLDVARKAAKIGYPIAFFSLEMTKEQLLGRLWAQESGISYAKIRNPKNLSMSELRELESTWIPRCNKLPIIIDDEAKHIHEIIPRAYLYMRKYKCRLIVVDYLQRVHAPGEKEYEIVSNASDAFTEFSKSTKIPSMILSQLSRPEDRKHAANVVPNMSMLRSSGRIEQNAHLILFTHRPEDDKGENTGEDVIVIGKQRAGVKGRIKAYFDGRTQVWDERGKTVEQAQQETMFKNSSNNGGNNVGSGQ